LSASKTVKEMANAIGPLIQFIVRPREEESKQGRERGRTERKKEGRKRGKERVS
jgi:hypothetical protein